MKKVKNANKGAKILKRFYIYGKNHLFL